jgi:hypothetical protein
MHTAVKASIDEERGCVVAEELLLAADGGRSSSLPLGEQGVRSPFFFLQPTLLPGAPLPLRRPSS